MYDKYGNYASLTLMGRSGKKLTVRLSSRGEEKEVKLMEAHEVPGQASAVVQVLWGFGCRRCERGKLGGGTSVTFNISG
jgi:hypothetical protein